MAGMMVIEPLEATTPEGLLTRIKSISSKAFEHLAVKLMARMGYGDLRPDAARVVGGTGDQGIDGVIRRDRLGLDVVYVQAKRWDGTVGRPEVQRFVGALQGKHANKGVLITTGTFSKGALEYANQIGSTVILIDGAQLVELMIESQLGVTTVAGEIDPKPGMQAGVSQPRKERRARPSPRAHDVAPAWVREPFRIPAVLALFALPIRPAGKTRFQRTLRFDEDEWLSVAYEAGTESVALPHGLDYLLWLWAVHEAIARHSREVYFDLLKDPVKALLDDHEDDSRKSERWRASWDRIGHCRIAVSSQQGFTWPQPVKLLQRISLPRRGEIPSPLIAGREPERRYGLLLSREMWKWLEGAPELVVLDRSLFGHLRNRPTALRYALFLLGWAQLHPRTATTIPTEKLAGLICGEWSRPRAAWPRLQCAHDEVAKYFTQVHGRQLRAEWQRAAAWEKPIARRRGPGRPRNRWELRFPPGRQLISGGRPVVAGQKRRPGT